MQATRCAKCAKPVRNYANWSPPKKTARELDHIEHEEDHRIIHLLEDCPEREKRSILRQLKKGEIDYDPDLDKLVYTDIAKQDKDRLVLPDDD